MRIAFCFFMQGKDILKSCINNYKLNLYDFHEKDRFDEFQTELRTLFEFLRYSNDEGELSEIIRNNSDRYENTDYETAELISVLAGIDIDEKIKISKEEDIETGEEQERRRLVNMCKAWEDHKESGRREGIKEGRREGRKEGIKEERKIIILNMLKRGMEDADIIELVECDKAFVEEIRASM